MLMLQAVDKAALVAAVCAGAVAFAAATLSSPLQPTLQHPPPRLHRGVLPFLLQYAYEFMHGQVYDLDVRHVGCSDKATTFRLIGMHIVSVFHPLDLEHVLVTNYFNYVKGSSYEVAKTLLGDALVTLPHGDKHSQHRRIVNPAFSPASLRRISQLAMEHHAMELVDVLRRAIRTQQGDVVMYDAVGRAALNIIAEAAFRLDKADLDDLATQLSAIRDKGISVLEFLPLINKLPTPAAQISARFRKLTGKIVEKAAQKLQASDAAEEGSGRAIIDFLVQSKQLTATELRDHGTTILLAGYDTSSNTVMWAMAHLCQHQAVQQKLFEELAAVMGPGMYPDIDVLRGCAYLTNVIKETMRVTPTVQDLPRTAVADDVLPYSKVVIPAGANVDVSIIGAHRNPRVYGPDANTFRPERWEDPGLEQRVGSCGFIPFSVGPRNCIGKEFAWNEMYVLISLIVRNFSFKFGEGQAFPKQIATIVTFPEPYRVAVVERAP